MGGGKRTGDSVKGGKDVTPRKFSPKKILFLKKGIKNLNFKIKKNWQTLKTNKKINV